jgi:hypothetical protein
MGGKRVTYRTIRETITDGKTDKAIFEETYPDARCIGCRCCKYDPECGFGSIGVSYDGNETGSETRNSYKCAIDTIPERRDCVKYGTDVRLAAIEKRLETLEWANKW